MNYQEFILQALKEVTKKPSKSEMEFAFLVLYKCFGLNPKDAIKQSMSL
jgi:hypothetical protein|tara:strand:+ start:239 stop:385 length:147 start_codon:yes stop_codon:yes gene_type:complete